MVLATPTAMWWRMSRAFGQEYSSRNRFGAQSTALPGESNENTVGCYFSHDCLWTGAGYSVQGGAGSEDHDHRGRGRHNGIPEPWLCNVDQIAGRDQFGRGWQPRQLQSGTLGLGTKTGISKTNHPETSREQRIDHNRIGP